MSQGKVKLGEVCTIEKGNVGITKAIPGEYPLVVLSEERKSHNHYQFDDEAVIIPLVSSTGHGHRSMKRIFFQRGKFSVGSILCAVIPNDKTKLSAEFLYRYLDLNKEKELVSRMKGMANVSLPMKELASVEIPLISIEKQRQLTETFRNLESYKRQITEQITIQEQLIKRLRRTLLHEAMRGNLLPQNSMDEPAEILLQKIKAEKALLSKDKRLKKEQILSKIKPEEVPFEVPSSWTWSRLGELFKFIDYRGRTPGRTERGVRLITAKNIRMGYIDNSPVEFISEDLYKKWMTRGFPKQGDLLFVTEGHTMGFVAEVNLDFNFALAQRTINLQPYLQSYAKFVFFFIMSPQFQDYIKQEATGSAATGIPASKLKEVLVPLPPLDEQKRIVEKFEKLLRFCDELGISINQSKLGAESFLQVTLKEALNKADKISASAQ